MFHTCFNGSYVRPIFPKRGLRQDDLLSPYLSLLCVERLSSSLSQASTNGRIRGCKISVRAPLVTHILFADDNFLFFS